MSDLLTILSRFPAPTAAQTCLTPLLGADGEVRLKARMAEVCVRELAALEATGEARIEVWYDGATSSQIRRWLGTRLRLKSQPGGELGERIVAPLRSAARSGSRCVVVASDVPALCPHHVRKAFSALDEADVVIGPSVDGGFYLLGARPEVVKTASPLLLRTLRWDTPSVMQRTIHLLKAAGLRVAQVDVLGDIDQPDDLMEALSRLTRPDAKVSVVVPALDSADRVRAAVHSAAAGADEVVLVDGGSHDRTRVLAADEGARVMLVPRGRGEQMNAGAAETGGDILLFLHADTVLPDGFADLARTALADERVAIGAFDLAVRGEGFLPWLISTVRRTRVRVTGFPYGDQALFMRRRTFEALGGFPVLPVMEDWELVRRARRCGRVVIVPAPVETSARQWRNRGVFRFTSVYAAIIAGYRVGVDPARLAEWRRRGVAQNE